MTLWLKAWSLKMLQAGHHGIGNKSLRCGAIYSHSPDVGDHLVRHFGSAGCRASNCVCRLAVPLGCGRCFWYLLGPRCTPPIISQRTWIVLTIGSVPILCELFAVLHRKLIANHRPCIDRLFNHGVLECVRGTLAHEATVGLPCVSWWCDRHCRAHDAFLGRVTSVFMAR